MLLLLLYILFLLLLVFVLFFLVFLIFSLFLSAVFYTRPDQFFSSKRKKMPSFYVVLGANPRRQSKDIDMSQRIPGIEQNEMIALWKGFVQRTLRRTNFRTTFNGATRTVYRDDTRLLVLDEYHGDLEVLEMQRSPGKATHLGSQEIDVTFELPPGGGKGKLRDMKLGKFHAGGKHKFVLTGSL
jgi:hypothetical protein